MTDYRGPKYVYGLADPTNGAIRYVGASKHPEVRYAQHLKGVGPPPRDFMAWLASLAELDFLPDLRILHPLTEDWRRIEKELQIEHGAALLDKMGRRRHLSQKPLREALGENLLAARKRSGMTREKAAERLFTTPTTIYRWENGDRAPSVSDLHRASRVYSVAPWMLIPDQEVSYGDQGQGEGQQDRARRDARKARKGRTRRD